MTNPIDIHVGKRLKALREQQNMKPAKLAKMAHITLEELAEYEAGSKRINPTTLAAVADALKVEIAYFFAGYEHFPTRDELVISANRGDRGEEINEQLIRALTNHEVEDILARYGKDGDGTGAISAAFGVLAGAPVWLFIGWWIWM